MELREKVDFLETNLTQTKNDLRLMSEQFNTSEKANLNLLTENESLKDKIGEKDRIITELIKLKKDLTNEVEILRSENIDIRQELERKTKGFENKIAELKAGYESELNEIKVTEREKEEIIEAQRHDIKVYNKNLENLRFSNIKLKEDNLKLNSQVSEKDSIISKLNEKVRESEKMVNLQKSYIKKIEEKEKETTSQLDDIRPFFEHRIMCPSCHATGSDIKEIEDRNKILGYYDHKPIYAKKHECKKCGYKF